MLENNYQAVVSYWQDTKHLGDKTLSVLDKEYNPPPTKLKSPTLMSDNTLSMLEKQYAPLEKSKLKSPKLMGDNTLSILEH